MQHVPVVIVSVCVLGTPVSPAETDGLIEMPFGSRTRVGNKWKCTLALSGEYD